MEAVKGQVEIVEDWLTPKKSRAVVKVFSDNQINYIRLNSNIYPLTKY